MSTATATTTVESLCDALMLSGLMSPDEVSTVRQRWFRPNREGVNDVAKFTKWLVMNQYLTDLQSQMLQRGQAASLFFNQYKLLERVGKGRMAGVYKAADGDGKLVAVKVLPPSKAKDPEILGRFQREARMSMKLNHPNLVRTLDAGEAHSTHYIVMEYLEGQTLEEVLQRRGKLSPVEAARIIGHALLGLQHIHEQQMVHRDLKPGNLMLASQPGKGRGGAQRVVKILDIGLGREMFDEPGADEDGGGLTVAGVMLGTLDYMAPEQARDAHSADIRADIYAMGCVLYHCLTAQPPFKGANMAQRFTQPPRPVRELAPDVPDTLADIVEQMMAVDPQQRYQAPAGAARAIRVFLNAEEQSAAPPPEALVAPTTRERTPEEDADEAPAATRRRRKAPAQNQAVLEAAWDAIKPDDRDIYVYIIGFLTPLFLIGALYLLTHIEIWSFVLVGLGGFVGWILHWYMERRQKQSP